ncbi:hypothetical protein [Archaeoglobus sulfaticallidus]|nr:hypothetical protein [Archaeoglobus sulfaticallidus]
MITEFDHIRFADPDDEDCSWIAVYRFNGVDVCQHEDLCSP